MSRVDLLLRQATVVLPHPETGVLTETVTDVAVHQGKIVGIGSEAGSDAAETLDLKGLHLLPGVIDSQVHFREPGLSHKEDLESGTRGALLGGVTAIFEMPNTKPSTTTEEAFRHKLSLAEHRAHVHYAFFMGGAPENADQLATLEKLPSCAGVKVFMGSSTGSLLVEEDVVLEKVLRSGNRRVAIHAEDEPRLRERKHIAVEGGHARFHPIWRDELTALNATKRIVGLAEKTKRPIHVLHVTSAEEMDFLKQHKTFATVEVLPQHLTLSAPEAYERWGTYAQMNPPIREARHRDRLWTALHDGTVDVIGSDHAPHTREEKDKPYPESPSGFPGVQTLVPLMLNHVNNGKLKLTKFVELVTEGPCRVYQVKNKGRIAKGFDADFTIIDLKRRQKIENSWIASKVGWSIYDGMEVTGWPVMTLLKGKVAMRDGQILRPSTGEPVFFE